MSDEPNTHKFIDRDGARLKVSTDRPMLVVTDYDDVAVFYLMTREGNPDVGLIRDLVVALCDMLPTESPPDVIASLPLEQQLKLAREARDHFAEQATRYARQRDLVVAAADRAEQAIQGVRSSGFEFNR